jgi:hypothetical protein
MQLKNGLNHLFNCNSTPLYYIVNPPLIIISELFYVLQCITEKRWYNQRQKTLCGKVKKTGKDLLLLFTGLHSGDK